MKQADHKTSRNFHPGEQEIIDITEEYPNIVRQALARSSGLTGEILVARQLEGMGCKVILHNNNLEQHDLTFFLNDLEVAHVEVKTGRDKRPTWFVRTQAPAIPSHSQDLGVCRCTTGETDPRPRGRRDICPDGRGSHGNMGFLGLEHGESQERRHTPTSTARKQQRCLGRNRA